jgi:hypothetical protein
VPENGTPGLMSGDWRRSTVSGPQRLQLDAWTALDLSATAPALDSTPLRALASVGVFTEVDGRRFALTPLAELLRSDVPGSMRALARMYGSEQYRAWGDLLDSVRTGRPAFDRTFGGSYFEHLARSREADAIFNEAMTG